MLLTARIPDATKVAFEAGDHAGMASGFGLPSPGSRVLFECAYVGELLFEGGLELSGSDEVLALLADVGRRDRRRRRDRVSSSRGQRGS